MMTSQSRQTKVLVALLFSIVLCTLILNALGHNPPSAGAFCLSQYNRLAPVEELIHTTDFPSRGYFNRIEIYCSDNGSINPITSGRQNFDCHFVIHNGKSDIDGRIEPTENWKNQLPITVRPEDNALRARQHERTIYICILINGQKTQPTNFQIKRLYILVEGLCRELKINPESVFYPNSWQY